MGREFETLSRMEPTFRKKYAAAVEKHTADFRRIETNSERRLENRRAEVSVETAGVNGRRGSTPD